MRHSVVIMMAGVQVKHLLSLVTALSLTQRSPLHRDPTCLAANILPRLPPPGFLVLPERMHVQGHTFDKITTRFMVIEQHELRPGMVLDQPRDFVTRVKSGSKWSVMLIVGYTSTHAGLWQITVHCLDFQ